MHHAYGGDSIPVLSSIPSQPQERVQTDSNCISTRNGRLPSLPWSQRCGHGRRAPGYEQLGMPPSANRLSPTTNHTRFIAPAPSAIERVCQPIPFTHSLPSSLGFPAGHVSSKHNEATYTTPYRNGPFAVTSGPGVISPREF